MSKKNILLITSDQQHFDTLGAFNSEIQTPNLDRLVQQGTTYNRSYCPNPTCTPTRASIITGMYPSQHGAWTLGTKLSEEIPTLGEYLQNVGYKTGLIGKAHFQPVVETEEYTSLESYPKTKELSFWKEFDKSFYGFEHVELARNHTNEHLVGQHYAIWMEEQGCKNWRDYFLPPTGNMDSDIKYNWFIPEKYHYNKWIADRSSAMLEKYAAQKERFFLWASFFDPHPPYLVPEPWCNMYDEENITIPEVKEGEHKYNPPHFKKTQEKNPDFSEYRETGHEIHGYHSHINIDDRDRKKIVSTYYGMISMMDKYIGKILDKLEQLGLVEDTVIIFTSDHGHFFGQHGLQYKGGFHYEDLIRVPFIVRYPSQQNRGEVSESMQSLVDLAPTILDIAEIDIPYHMTGISQKKTWQGLEKKVRDHIICEFRHEPTTIHQKTYVDDRYKITVYYNENYGELFDLKADPEEVHNLWFDTCYSDLKMKLLLKYIWAELGKESLSMPRISHA